MVKKLLFFIPALFFNLLSMQAQDLEFILNKIESNNPDLIAYQRLMQAKTQDYKSQNKLPDMRALGYYLPFGMHNTSDYWEFEVTQTIEFPTVYSARKNWIDKQNTKLELEYLELKTDILLKAKKLILKLIYLKKLEEKKRERKDLIRQAFNQVEEKVKNGKSSEYELNKARVILLDQEFSFEKIQLEKKKCIRELKKLNGGEDINPKIDKYPLETDLPVWDTTWDERKRKDPQIALKEQEKLVAEQKIKIQRNQLLPNISAGYNYQGVPSSYYHGFYGGLSLPLWRRKSEMQNVRSSLAYVKQAKLNYLSELKAQFEMQIKEYEHLYNKFTRYRAALALINSEEEVMESYKKDELNFMGYYEEISFLWDSENRVLQFEQDLQLIRSEIFAYKLAN